MSPLLYQLSYTARTHKINDLRWESQAKSGHCARNCARVTHLAHGVLQIVRFDDRRLTSRNKGSSGWATLVVAKVIDSDHGSFLWSIPVKKRAAPSIPMISEREPAALTSYC